MSASIAAALAAGTTAYLDSAGVLAFLSFVFLIVAVVLLYRSMSKQMRKVSPDLPDGPIDRMREEDAEIIAEARRRGAQGATGGAAGAAGGDGD